MSHFSRLFFCSKIGKSFADLEERVCKGDSLLRRRKEIVVLELKTVISFSQRLMVCVVLLDNGNSCLNAFEIRAGGKPVNSDMATL